MNYKEQRKNRWARKKSRKIRNMAFANMQSRKAGVFKSKRSRKIDKYLNDEINDVLMSLEDWDEEQ